MYSDDNIPDRILATYTDDYDILRVDDIIRAKLNLEKDELPQIIQKKEMLEKRLDEQLKIVERKKITSQLKEINDKIDEIEEGKRIRKYIEETKELIDKYKQIGPIVKVKSFTNGEEELDKDPQYQDRINIIKKYLNIAKNYIPTSIARIIPNDSNCPNCNTPLIADDPDEQSLEQCFTCGFERLNFSKTTFFKESPGQSKSLTNSDYEDKENFLKALECYLGEETPPPQSVLNKLDEWSYKYGHPTKEEIRNMPFNDDGTRGEYGKSMMIQALADEGLADYYKDWKLIGHLLWGWRLPNISQQDRELILSDYDATQKIFNSIKGERKSSMNTQLRLYRHLEARKIDCRPADFKLPTTPGILEEQDGFWKEMVKVIPGAEFTSLK